MLKKKEHTDPIVDTPVIIPFTSSEPTPPTKEEEVSALRTRLEAEIRKQIADEEKTKVDPGFLRPGVRSPYQDAMSHTTVQSGNIPMNGEPAKPSREYEVTGGTIRQDF